MLLPVTAECNVPGELVMPDRGNEDENRRLRNFLETGSEIAGHAASTAIAMLVAGPGGAVVGAATGPMASRMLRYGAMEFMRRTLSDRQMKRTAGVLGFAAERIGQKVRLGYEPRHDGFFVGEPGARSAAEEIAEGVMLAAQQEHEERKIPFMGSMLANFAFDNSIDRGQANMLIRLAERLSYRQLCLVALFADKQDFELRSEDYTVVEGRPYAHWAVLQEIYDLGQTNVLSSSRSITTIIPRRIETRPWGELLYQLMDLRRMPAEELHDLATVLR